LCFHYLLRYCIPRYLILNFIIKFFFITLAKNNTKEIEEEVIAECYDDIDDANDNSGSDSQDSDEENDKPDPKVLDKFKVSFSDFIVKVN